MPETFEITFPLSGGGNFQYRLQAGEILFMLGANGTGKSSLVTQIYMANSQNTKRISAHRQTWFNSNSLDMTPSARNSMEENIRGQDTQTRSRHHLEYSAQRTSIAIFDLIDADTMLARRIADLVRAGNMEAAGEEAKNPAPLDVINQLMQSSNIPIKIEVEERQKIVARKNGGAPYSVAELSDGERNAFLIASDVLTAKPGTLILIDEPERHLHRSIVSPLLTLLFQQRADCSFLVSTHELMLPVDNPASATLLIRSCEYSGSTARSWMADLLPADASLDEGLKLDILGGRQKMIFVEGVMQSLDAPLYSLLFPQVSIVPKSNCRDVEYAVRGLRGAETKHWIRAWGIVDNDRRGADEIEDMRNRGIYALPHFSVEALYYHPVIIKKIAIRMAEVTGVDPNKSYEAAVAVAISEAGNRREHFVVDAVERLTRRAFIDQLPRKSDIKAGGQVNVAINVDELRAAEESVFDQVVAANDLETILEKYPLRESGALSGVAKAVGLKNRGDYENAVRLLVQSDLDAKDFLLSLFGELVEEVLN